KFAVAGRSRGQEQERIPFVNLISVFGFPEQFAAIGELGFERGTDLRPNPKAAVSNSRADCSLQLRGIAAEMFPHFADTLFYDPLSGAAPPRVKDADGAPLGVGDDYGQAVGSKHREKK